MARSFVAPLALLLSLLALPAQALSSGIVVRITSVLEDTLGTGLGVGDWIEGSFGHSDCADQGCRDYYNPTENLGDYYDLGVGVDLALGAYQVSQGSGYYQSDIVIWNDRAPSGFDSYSASYDVYDGPDVTPQPGGVLIDVWSLSFSVVLTDDDGTVFDYGYIPSELPPLNRFESSSFHVNLRAFLLDEFGDPSGESVAFQATGEIAHLPEPASGVLGGLGLVGLGAWRRESRRRPGRKLR